MVLPRQLGLNDHLAEVSLVLLDALDYVVSDLDEVLFLDHEAKGLQDLFLVGQVLVTSSRADRNRGLRNLIAAALYVSVVTRFL